MREDTAPAPSRPVHPKRPPDPPGVRIARGHSLPRRPRPRRARMGGRHAPSLYGVGQAGRSSRDDSASRSRGSGPASALLDPDRESHRMSAGRPSSPSGGAAGTSEVAESPPGLHNVPYRAFRPYDCQETRCLCVERPDGSLDCPCIRGDAMPTTPQPCPRCSGRGLIELVELRARGATVTIRSCPDCMDGRPMPAASVLAFFGVPKNGPIG